MTGLAAIATLSIVIGILSIMLGVSMPAIMEICNRVNVEQDERTIIGQRVGEHHAS